MTISDVKKDIAPFLKKGFLSKAYIESADIEPRPGRDGRPCLKIHIKALLFPTEVEYEIRVKGRKNRTHDSLSWIDRIEEMH